MESVWADNNIAMLLPFWVNGSLAQDDAEAVQNAVASDSALAADADFQRALRDRMQAEASSYSPGEIGLARLKRSIAAQPVVANQTRRLPLQQVAAVVALAALLGFAANEVLHTQPAEYVQASSGDDIAAVTVGFQADATAQAISDFLLSENVVILDGPSAVGLYRVAPLQDAQVNLADLAQRLQARDDLFDVVDLPE